MDNTPLPNAILILLSIHERPDQRIQHRHQLFPRAEVQPDDALAGGARSRNVGLLFSKQPLPPQRGRVDGDDETVVRTLQLLAGMLR